MAMRIKIDTHIHSWNIEKVEYEWLKGNTSILNRSYSLDEFNPQREDIEVSYGVMVQAANNFEDTFFMLEECEKRNWLLGTVGWLPMLEPEKWDENLQKISTPYLKGIRHLIHDEPNPNWLLQRPVVESFAKLVKANLSFDVVAVLPEHLDCVLKLSEKMPDIRWCIDHLGHPPTKKKERFGQWGESMKALASNPNVFVKISGLGMTVSDLNYWEYPEIQPYVEFCLENFGIERAMLGGDWPVSNLCGGYAKSWNAYEEILSKVLSDKELELIQSKNAIQFYKLKP